MARVMSNDELSGKRIITQDGRVVGEIDSLHIDVETWSVSAIGIKVRKEVLEELSLKRPLIGTQVIRVPSDQISGTSDMIVLKPAFSELLFEGGVVVESVSETEAEDGSEDKPLL